MEEKFLWNKIKKEIYLNKNDILNFKPLNSLFNQLDIEKKWIQEHIDPIIDFIKYLTGNNICQFQYLINYFHHIIFTPVEKLPLEYNRIPLIYSREAWVLMKIISKFIFPNESVIQSEKVNVQNNNNKLLTIIDLSKDYCKSNDPFNFKSLSNGYCVYLGILQSICYKNVGDEFFRISFSIHYPYTSIILDLIETNPFMIKIFLSNLSYWFWKKKEEKSRLGNLELSEDEGYKITNINTKFINEEIKLVIIDNIMNITNEEHDNMNIIDEKPNRIKMIDEEHNNMNIVDEKDNRKIIDEEPNTTKISDDNITTGDISPVQIISNIDDRSSEIILHPNKISSFLIDIYHHKILLQIIDKEKKISLFKDTPNQQISLISEIFCFYYKSYKSEKIEPDQSFSRYINKILGKTKVINICDKRSTLYHENCKTKYERKSGWIISYNDLMDKITSYLKNG